MNIWFSPTFQRQLLLLEKVDARNIGSLLNRLELSDQPLGKRLGGDLHGCYSIRVGLRQRLRLVYELVDTDASVLVVGPREHGMVYIQALEVLKELER